MKSIINITKLDFLILKPYRRTLILILFILPVLVSLPADTFTEGLSFTTVILAMTVGYPFSVGEKYGLASLYGLLPVRKRQLVYGRYLTTFLIAFGALILNTVLQFLIRSVRGKAPALSETAGAFLFCAFLYCIYACIQIPGYYLFGSITGKLFIFIPTICFVMMNYFLQPNTAILRNPSSHPLSGAAAMAAGMAGFLALILALSVSCSVKIAEKIKNPAAS